MISEISVTETITETEMIGPTLTEMETMEILENGNIIKTEMKTFKTYRNGNVRAENGNKRKWCARYTCSVNESLKLKHACIASLNLCFASVGEVHRCVVGASRPTCIIRLGSASVRHFTHLIRIHRRPRATGKLPLITLYPHIIGYCADSLDGRWCVFDVRWWP